MNMKKAEITWLEVLAQSECWFRKIRILELPGSKKLFKSEIKQNYHNLFLTDTGEYAQKRQRLFLIRRQNWQNLMENH